MLPARHRLTERADFAATVRGRGTRRQGSRLLVVHARVADATQTDARGDDSPRVGLVVSTAVGNAVTRTRVKRRLRAQVAPLLADLPHGTDLVIRANPAAAGADSHELGAALRHCVHALFVEQAR
ncbi:ribonuclease P protein component [Janibacter sp. G349]|uniref:ribonuclease P protein component n=1 Tax=unclassified Janibacter TaxID=2649294 RepID=UPI0020CFC892|nr:ribonuclease P protein component [Janibacter sp. CX7]UTT66138.1 ribonuclease P protein component [Janibacter sp. CX7]